MHQANVSNFTIVDTTPAKQVKSTPILKVVDSPKTHRLNENLAIIKEVLNGNYNRAQEYTGMGGLQKELCTRQSELINTLGQERTNQLIESATSGYFTPVKLVDYTYDIIRQLGFTGGRILEP